MGQIGQLSLAKQSHAYNIVKPLKIPYLKFIYVLSMTI